MSVDTDFIAAMYGPPDEPEPKRSEAIQGDGETILAIPARGIISLPALSSIVRSQAKIIANLTAKLAEKERMLRRLEARLSRVERHSSSVGLKVNSLDGEMSNKIDRRDY